MSSYAYEPPSISDKATRRFLRRSQMHGIIGDAVADYDRRVRDGEPYTDTVDLAEFTIRYSLDEREKP